MSLSVETWEYLGEGASNIVLAYTGTKIELVLYIFTLNVLIIAQQSCSNF